MSHFIELKKLDRKFEKIDSMVAILNLLNKNIHITLYIKYDIEKTLVQISKIYEDNSLDIVTDPNYLPENNKMTVYGLLEKYIEINLNIVEIKGPGFFRCTIDKFNSAIEIRKELRLKVTPEQVIASNFMISRHAIDISNYKIPTAIKVLLDQFHSENLHICDIFKVDIFENDAVLEKIKKTRKILYIKDINNPDSDESDIEDIIDPHEVFEDSFQEYLKKDIEKGYKSIIIAPIIYITDSGKEIAFAYAQLISKSKLFEADDVRIIKELLTKLITRLKDANTVYIHTNQQITNLSRSGARLYITDENLKKYLISTNDFIFNIVFKFQAPITIYCEIKNILRDDENNLFIGIAFAGHSSRKDEMKRYYAFLEPMIKKYKEQLLKQRKKQVTQGRSE